MAVCIGFIEKRENVLAKISQSNDYVAMHCNFCKNCYKHKIIKGFKEEIRTKGIKTFNQDKKWWSIDWRKDKDGDNIPILKFHDRMKVNFS